MDPEGLHPAQLSEAELLKDCQVRRERRSGPGGQHRNKVETAVVIQHSPTGISGQAAERRSQAENRKIAIFRLRLELATQVRRLRELSSYTNSLCWSERCRRKHLNVSEKSQVFPGLLAEAMDVLFSTGLQVSEAGQLLQISSSQLIKLLKKHAPAFEAVNRARVAAEFRPLK